MHKNLIISVLVFILFTGLIILGFNTAFSSTDKNDCERVRQSIKEAILECYALEGSYPENLKYLEDNYGIYVNREYYQLHYRYLGANIMPEFTVFEKGA